MADQQELPARAITLPLGDEVSGAIPRRALRPARGEAELLELRCERVSHSAHAGKVVRAAVDVDQAFQQRDRLRRSRVNRRNDPAFRAR